MTENEKLVFNLTPKAVACIMLIVNKGMLARAQDRPEEEWNVPQLLMDLEFVDTAEGLHVLNPPNTLEIHK